MPILIAGSGERITLRLVASTPDSWHAAFPDRAGGARAEGRRARAVVREIGRDPAEIERGVGVEPDDLERFLTEDADAYVALGFTQFTLGVNGPDWEVGSAVERGSPGATSETRRESTGVAAAPPAC